MRVLLQPTFVSILVFFMACGQADTGNSVVNDPTDTIPERQMPERENITYTFLTDKDSIKAFSGSELDAVLFLNRCDEAALKGMDSVIVPSKFAGDIIQYSPFPFHVASLEPVKKIVFFSYPAQVFAAYEHGYLVRSGPTNMGREKDPTPTGLFFANWKAEETTSTFNDEWELKWNFNIANKEGVGWHQYSLPGYPASHSCLRMRETDAKYMYDWAQQWVLEGTDNIKANGTPVIVFGTYPFGGTKPWIALPAEPHALDITENMLNSEVQPHMDKILEEQRKRASYP